MSRKTKNEPVIRPEEELAADMPAENAETEPASEAADAKSGGKTNAADQAEPESYQLTADEFRQVQAEIEKLRKEKAETVALLQRNQADFDNYRRRNATARADSYEEGKRDCIKALLPVLDNFDRALDNASASDDNWREGVKLVEKQFRDLLNKQGLEEVDANGQFDPNLHEAVMREKVEGSNSGDVLAVLQKGYRVGDRIIRHSMVKVAE